MPAKFWFRGKSALQASLFALLTPSLQPASAQEPTPDPLVAAATAAERSRDPVAAQASWTAVLDREVSQNRGTGLLAQQAMRQIASALQRQGRAGDALALAQRATELARADFGATADWTLSGERLLAAIHSDTGNHDAAIALIDGVVAVRRSRPQTEIINRNNLAMALYGASGLYAAAAQWQAAIDATREAIEVERSAGASQQTLTYRATTLAVLLFNANQRDESRQVLAAALPGLREHYPIDGPSGVFALQQIQWLGRRLVYEAGDYAAAVPLLTEACDGWRRRNDADWTFSCLSVLADAYDRQDMEREELPARRELLELARRREGPASPGAMQAAAQLVEALGEAGEIDAATIVARETLAIPAVAALPVVDRAQLMDAVASSSLLAGNLDEAEPLFRAIAAAVQPVPERREQLAQAMAGLAAIAYARNNFLEASVGFDQWLPELEAFGGRSGGVAQLFRPMAEVAAARSGRQADAPKPAAIGIDAAPMDFAAAFAAFAGGDFAAAAPGFAAARADIERRLPGPARDPSVQTILAYIQILQAASLDELGNAQQAEQLFREAIVALQPISGELAANFRAAAFLGVGRIQYDRGAFGEAVASFEQARTLAQSNIFTDSIFLITLNEELADAQRRLDPTSRAPLEALTRSIILARQSRDRAALGSDAGDSAAEQALARTTASERSTRDPLRQVYADWLDEASRETHRDVADDAVYRDAVFGAVQDLALSNAGSAMRATAARLSLGTGRAAELGREQLGLAERARAIEARLAATRSSGVDSDIQALSNERMMIGIRLAEIDAEIDDSAPAYRMLLRPRAVSLRRLRERLERDEGLLLVAGGGEYDYYVVAVSRSNFAWQRVGDGAAVEGFISRVRCSLDPTTCAIDGTDTGDLPAFDVDAAHALYQRLIAPVADGLGNAQRIFVTATGRLGELPFGVLATEPPQPGTSPAWFADRASFIVLPSVAALRAVPRTPRESSLRSPYIGYGAPDFAPPPVPSAAATPAGLADPAMLRSSFGPLATARIEMREVARAVGAAESRVHIAAAATERAIRRDADLATARVLHFATHGLLPDPRSPMILNEPGLVFTPPPVATAEDDGVLSASEAATMPISADWVILSACTTATAGGGAPNIRDADSLGLLARAFLYSGARRLVASHWNLSDATGRILVGGMLRDVADQPQLRPSEALARMQAAVRTGRRADGSELFGWDPSWRHPFFWAALSLIAYDDER